MVKRQEKILDKDEEIFNSDIKNKKLKKEIKFTMITRGKKTYKNQTIKEITLLLNRKKQRKKLSKNKDQEKLTETEKLSKTNKEIPNKELNKIIKANKIKINKEEPEKNELKLNKDKENKDDTKPYKENTYKNKLKASIQVKR